MAIGLVMGGIPDPELAIREATDATSEAELAIRDVAVGSHRRDASHAQPHRVQGWRGWRLTGKSANAYRAPEPELGGLFTWCDTEA